MPYVVERLCQPPHCYNNADRWCVALTSAQNGKRTPSLTVSNNYRFIPTGFQSKELIVKAGLNLGDVDQFPTIDVTIDGADEVDVCLPLLCSGCPWLREGLMRFCLLSRRKT